MPPSAPASSISTSRRPAFQAIWGAMVASLRAKLIERFQISGWGGYLLISIVRPIFELSIMASIYRQRPELISYVVVAVAAQALIFSAIFFVGEILDRERMGGTLPALFLAPCPRLAWLGGFALVGLVESALIAAATLLMGRLALGVVFDPNLPAVLLTLALLITALAGLGFVFSAIGLALRKANELSNLVNPFVILLGGVYYPVALLPDWLRLPALVLPLGYGMQALADAALNHASIVELVPNLLPLAGFALALPCAGWLAFRLLERFVRERGELELY